MILQTDWQFKNVMIFEDTTAVVMENMISQHANCDLKMVDL